MLLACYLVPGLVYGCKYWATGRRASTPLSPQKNPSEASEMWFYFYRRVLKFTGQPKVNVLKETDVNKLKPMQKHQKETFLGYIIFIYYKKKKSHAFVVTTAHICEKRYKGRQWEKALNVAWKAQEGCFKCYVSTQTDRPFISSSCHWSCEEA